MSQTITVKLPDALYAALKEAAKAEGTTPAEWVVTSLGRQLPVLAPDRWTEEERRQARARYRRHFGAIHSGDCRSGDNERIDADLARGYAGVSPEEG